MKNELNKVINPLNSKNPRIKLTIEIEENQPFLYLLLYKEEDDSPDHSNYRSRTPTNRCLNSISYHHLAQLATFYAEEK